MTLGRLELVDTFISWLTVDLSLVDWSLSASSSDSDSVDDIALLSFESELSCLVWSGRPVAFVDDWELSVFPGSDSEKESHDIRLFLTPKFFKILVCSHTFFLI